MSKIKNSFILAGSLTWILWPFVTSLAMVVGFVWTLISLFVVTWREHAEFIWAALYLFVGSFMALFLWIIIQAAIRRRDPSPGGVTLRSGNRGTNFQERLKKAVEEKEVEKKGGTE